MSHRVFYTDHFALPLPEGHRFPISKYRLVRERLEADGVLALEPAELAKPEVVALAQDADYVERFSRGELSAEQVRRIGFPWSPELVARSFASVGATLGAVRDALETGWGGTLAGGTHHAFRGEGAGYCVFNDLAVAVYWLRADRLARRVAILDLDVHQGDGTAAIFDGDPDVLTVSIHCVSNFPFRKQRSVIDLELPAGTDDAAYLRTLEFVLPQVEKFRPEVILYQSGVDTLATDKLGHMKLTHDGLRERDRLVFSLARALDVPIAITMGGGYSEPIELTAEAHANTFRVALEVLGAEKPTTKNTKVAKE